MENQDGYLQIGVTALRDPRNGEYLPAVPLYIKAEDGAEEDQQRLIDDIGNLLAKRMKMYLEGCREAGAAV